VISGLRGRATETGDWSGVPPYKLSQCCRGDIESALAQPPVHMFGHERHVGLLAKAAAYLYFVSQRQACPDGNKRLGFVIAGAFLRRNRCELLDSFNGSAPAMRRILANSALGVEGALDALVEAMRGHVLLPSSGSNGGNPS